MSARHLTSQRILLHGNVLEKKQPTYCMCAEDEMPAAIKCHLGTNCTIKCSVINRKMIKLSKHCNWFTVIGPRLNISKKVHINYVLSFKLALHWLSLTSASPNPANKIGITMQDPGVLSFGQGEKKFIWEKSLKILYTIYFSKWERLQRHFALCELSIY